MPDQEYSHFDDCFCNGHYASQSFSEFTDRQTFERHIVEVEAQQCHKIQEYIKNRQKFQRNSLKVIFVVQFQPVNSNQIQLSFEEFWWIHRNRWTNQIILIYGFPNWI